MARDPERAATGPLGDSEPWPAPRSRIQGAFSRRLALLCLLTFLALASGTAAARGMGGGHGGGFGGGGHLGGGHFGGAGHVGHGHFGFPGRGGPFVLGGPFVYPDYDDGYAPYVVAPDCDPYSPYYDPLYCE